MSVASPTRDGHGRERVLRLAPELRRCAGYCVAGWFVVTGVMIALSSTELLPRAKSWPEVAFMMSPFFLGPAVLAWRYGLRVDDRGVWRRWVFRWDLWPWEAFAGGNIRQGATRYGWVYPDKPWYARELSFGYLGDADCDWLTERVRQVWTPPVIERSDGIQLRFRRGLRRWHMELSAGGIALWLTKGDQLHCYRWSHVVRVRVTRLAHGRRDFTKLELEFPEGVPAVTLRGRPDGERCNWGGQDAEVVLDYLQRYVGVDRIQVTAETGAPQTSDEADRRLRDLDRITRELRQIGWVMYALLLPLVFLPFFGRSGALFRDGYGWLVAGPHLLLLGLLGIAIRKLLSEKRHLCGQQRTEIESWIAGHREHSP
jgi:hypothetical protein